MVAAQEKRDKKRRMELDFEGLLFSGSLSAVGLGWFMFKSLQLSSNKWTTFAAFSIGTAGISLINAAIFDIRRSQKKISDPQMIGELAEALKLVKTSTDDLVSPDINLDEPEPARAHGEKPMIDLRTVCDSCKDALKKYNKNYQGVPEQTSPNSKCRSLSYYDKIQIILEDYRKKRGLQSAIDHFQEYVAYQTRIFRQKVFVKLAEFVAYIEFMKQNPDVPGRLCTVLCFADGRQFGYYVPLHISEESRRDFVNLLVAVATETRLCMEEHMKVLESSVLKLKLPTKHRNEAKLKEVGKLTVVKGSGYVVRSDTLLSVTEVRSE